MDCLRYQERERPSSEELCQRLAGLKENTEYGESVHQVEREKNDVAMLETQIGEMQVREAATVQQLHDELRKKDVTIRSKDDQLERCQQQESELRSQLEVQEQVTAEIQYSLQRHVEQIQQLSQQLLTTTKSTQPPQPVALEAQVRGRQLQQNQVKQSQPLPVQKSHTSTKKLMITEWKDGGKTPNGMERGACVVDGDVAYFMNRLQGQTCSFNSSTRRWSQLPKCPYWYSSLAVIKGLLTAIGGKSHGGDENKLLSIVDDRNKKWVEHFPPMPTKRLYTAAVTTRQHLIISGGKRGLSYLNTVEVLDIDTLVWSTAASLPHTYSKASATICGDHLYMLGSVEGSGATKSVLTCSLTELQRSCGETSSDSVWSRIADAPVVYSTCAAVGGELVAVGGRDVAERKDTSAVYKYNMISEFWNVITNMPTARCVCLVAVLPTNEMIVVGGYRLGQNIVEIAKITHHD